MRHTCHWSGCDKSVPPAMWGCRDHWFALPGFLRDAVWKYYRPGQEITKTPSSAYLAIAELVRMWIETSSVQINGRRLDAAQREKIDSIFVEALKTVGA